MRPDYCPIANEPCQSLCETPCDRKDLRAARADIERLHAAIVRADLQIGDGNIELARWTLHEAMDKTPNT